MDITWERPLQPEVVINWLINDIVLALRKGEISIPQSNEQETSKAI